MNNDDFIIEREDLSEVQDICGIIADDEIRSRAVGNSLAAKVAKKYFDELIPDVTSGLHNVAQILEDYEISDIYINGNYIDVRVYFNDDDLYVPVSHFKNNLLPAAYMFIKLDNDMYGGHVTGFAIPSNINTEHEIDGYYKLSEDELVSFFEVESYISNTIDEEVPADIEKQIFNYLDGKVADKYDLYRNLIKSQEARQILLKASKAQVIFKNMAFPAKVETEADDFQNTLELSQSETDYLEPPVLLEPEVLESDDDIISLEQGDGIMSIDDSVELEENLDQPLNLNFEETGSISEDSNIEYPDDTISFADNNEDISEIGIAMQTDDFLKNETLEPETISLAEPHDKFAESQDSETEYSDYSQEAVDSVIESFETEENKEPEIGEITLEQNYDYGTESTPSLEDITSENNVQNYSKADKQSVEEGVDDIDVLFNEQENAGSTEEYAELPQEASYEDSNTHDEISENSQDYNAGYQDYTSPVKSGTSKKKSGLLPLLCLIIAAGGIYFGYTKYAQSNTVPSVDSANNIDAETLVADEVEPKRAEENPMPVETVENVKKVSKSEEGTAVSIPAIEKNLDASVAVANLSVNWEVPAEYANNQSAKNYFVKLGKVLRLNLKTELLLMSKMPIANKISIALEYDKGAKKFVIKEMTESSGEKTIDDTIKRVVTNALQLNLSSNMSIFDKIEGTPVLVIRL